MVALGGRITWFDHLDIHYPISTTFGCSRPRLTRCHPPSPLGHVHLSATHIVSNSLVALAGFLFCGILQHIRFRVTRASQQYHGRRKHQDRHIYHNANISHAPQPASWHPTTFSSLLWEWLSGHYAPAPSQAKTIKGVAFGCIAIPAFSSSVWRDFASFVLFLYQAGRGGATNARIEPATLLRVFVRVGELTLYAVLGAALWRVFVSDWSRSSKGLSCTILSTIFVAGAVLYHVFILKISFLLFRNDTPYDRTRIPRILYTLGFLIMAAWFIFDDVSGKVDSSLIGKREALLYGCVVTISFLPRDLAEQFSAWSNNISSGGHN